MNAQLRLANERLVERQQEFENELKDTEERFSKLQEQLELSNQKSAK